MTPLSTPEELRREAEEAERMADTVSYGPDKVRLKALAASLRARAEAAEARQARPPPRRRT